MKSAICLFATCALFQTNLFAEPSLQTLATANNTFAFKLLKQVAAEKPGDNIFISPYSAVTALQIVENGSAGETKTEMQQTLETSSLSAIELNQAAKAAADLLNSNTNLILTTANALWYRQGA